MYIETLLKTNPLNFVYVELNSIMQSNANILSKLYSLINDKINSEFYKQIAHRFQIGINAVSIFIIIIQTSILIINTYFNV